MFSTINAIRRTRGGHGRAVLDVEIYRVNDGDELFILRDHDIDITLSLPELEKLIKAYKKEKKETKKNGK